LLPFVNHERAPILYWVNCEGLRIFYAQVELHSVKV
jgi:hypothetical protein